ncbi:MAG: class I SAM-dependent methyltransferase [Halanaeroarchaeum sp.]
MHDVPFFDRVAPLYDLVLPATDAAPIQEGFSHAERQIRTVVDLGGGTGRAARAMEDDAIVFDGSKGMLDTAVGHGLSTVRGDVRHLPFPPGSLDGVVSVDAMHHFPAIDVVIDAVYDALAVGGAFVVREFDPSTIRGRFLVLGERLIRFDSTFFTVESLVDRLAAAGFDTTVTERGFVYTVVGVKPGES